MEDLITWLPADKTFLATSPNKEIDGQISGKLCSQCGFKTSYALFGWTSWERFQFEETCN